MIEEIESAVALKYNKLMLSKGENLKISQLIKEKMAIDKVSTFYSLGKHYNFASLADSSLSYIKRCFQMVVEN